MPKKLKTKTLPKQATLKAVAPATPISESPATKAVKPKPLPRFTHNVATTYKPDASIQSLSFNKKRSRTRIATDTFDTLPDALLTVRDETFLRALKATYASEPFARADCDAGNMRRASERGYLKHVSGDTASEASLFQLTPKAIKNIIA